MERKISVVVPIYKVEKYLRQCLDSIVNQTYQNLEIILVDDGSPDGCGAICDEYAAQDPRVVVIHKENGGLSAARNDGIRRATGEWIAFVDSDDWCESDYYERLLGTADPGGADVILAGGYFVEYPDSSKKARTFKEVFTACEKDRLEELTVKTLFPCRADDVRFGYPWDKLYKRSFILEQGLLFDTSQRAWEDCWFNFRAFSRAKTIAACGAAGYHYRQTDGSITRGYDPKRTEIMYNVLSVMKQYADLHQLSGRLLAAVQEIPIGAFSFDLRNFFSPENRAPYKETARAIKRERARLYYHEAIWGKTNICLSKSQIVLKYALRLPWVWPTRLLYSGNQWLRKIRAK